MTSLPNLTVRAVSALVFASTIAVSTNALGDEDEIAQPPAEFFAGEYSLLGRAPDNGAPYFGSARIEVADEDTLILERTFSDQTTREAIRLNAPEISASGDLIYPRRVLYLHDEQGIMIGSCQWDIDADNYPRITCLRVVANTTPSEPGYEALFPQH